MPPASPESQETLRNTEESASEDTSFNATGSVATSHTLPRTLYGGILLLAAAGATLALVFSFVAVPNEPQSQVAAAEAREEIDYFKDVEIEGRAAYVYDATAGKELYLKNANLQLPLASITKIMLVLAVAEVLTPEDIVPITHTAVEKGEGGLTWGEEWRMRDLVDFTLITSSNTGAEALAEAADARLRAKYPAAPKGSAAVWRMNAIAQELGLDETYFINGSGLDESETQAGSLGSASDIALLFKHALETNAELFSGTTRSGVPLGPLNYPEREANNTNNVLAQIAGIRMGKTGTTDLAGGNLAVAFDANNHTMIVVVLGATPLGRFEDVMTLVETARKSVSTAN
jgi:serine-type D-Ala-D-Ala carboxypeptidase (penicillin-binding protein 5/6)